MGCDHNCGSCGGCGSCKNGGCGGAMELSEEEIAMLRLLGQFAFLPVARKADDDFPPETYTLVLRLLEKKGLISLDYDRPLGNFSSKKYGNYPIIGSMALTLRGQKVLEILETQGITF